MRSASVVALFVFLGCKTRRGDKPGRVLIPKELRNKHGLGEYVDAAFIEGVEGITIKASGNLRKLCRKSIPEKAKVTLCEECASEMERSCLKKK